MSNEFKKQFAAKYGKYSEDVYLRL